MSLSRRYLLLIGVVIAAVCGWTAWWFYLAGEVETRTAAWLEAERARGTQVDHQGLTVSGFPYRIEVDVENLALAMPQVPYAPSVTIPHLKVLGLPWNPNLVIADVTGPVVLGWTDDRNQAQSALYDAKSTAVSIGLVDGIPVRLSASAQYARLSAAVMEGLVTAKLFEIHIRDRRSDSTVAPATPAERGNPTAPPAIELALDGDTVELPSRIETPLGRQIARLGLSLALTGPLPADPTLALKAILGAWRDAGGTIEIGRGDLLWGGFDLSLTGSLALDSQFRPEGALSGRVGGLDIVLDAAVADRRLTADQARSIGSALGALSFLSRDEAGRVPVGVTLQGGRVLVGPVAVGTVEPLFQR